MTDQKKPAPSDIEKAQDGDLDQREETLSTKLDDLEAEVKPKRPKAPPIGAMF